MQLLPTITLVSVLIAIIAMAVKALRYIRAPESLRWELYPVPHDRKRARYGGSYLEELDWWTKPRHTDRLREWREMVSEILLLKGVFHHNRRVWVWSFPFHFGLYLCIGWLALLFVGGMIQATGHALQGANAGTIGRVVHGLTVPVGYVGLVLAFVGSLGLWFWRMSDRAQRRYNAPIDYFNLILVALVTGFAAVAQVLVDPVFVVARGYAAAVMTFGPFAGPGLLFTLEVLSISFLIAWIPLTRMSHFVAKYFLYHAVRWNDKPNRRGSKLEQSLLRQLSRRVTWAGPHVRPGETWAQTANEPKTDE